MCVCFVSLSLAQRRRKHLYSTPFPGQCKYKIEEIVFIDQLYDAAVVKSLGERQFRQVFFSYPASVECREVALFYGYFFTLCLGRDRDPGFSGG